MSDTEHTDAPVCPHCGKTIEDVAPRFRVCDDDVGARIAAHDITGRFDCGHCGEELFVTRHVAITYSTRKP